MADDSRLSNWTAVIDDQLICHTARAESFEYAVLTFGLSRLQLELVLRGTTLEETRDLRRPTNSLGDWNI